MFIYFGISLLSGFLIANQTPVNADLRKTVASPFFAATISQIFASLFLALVSFSSSGLLFPSTQFIHTFPLWIWIGGLLGPIYMTSNIFLFPKLGAVQTVILPVLGQILMGVLIDSFGWIKSPLIPMTGLRFLGIMVTIFGIIIAVALPSLKRRKQVSEKHGNNSGFALLPYQIWGILSGTLVSLQSTLNGHLGVLLHSAADASFLSIFIGLLLLLIVTPLVEKRMLHFREIQGLKAWHSFGGIFGPLFVLGLALSVPVIGTGLTIVMALLGQIVGSMLVQQFGWWKSLKFSISRYQVLGVMTMLLGIGIIKFL